MKQTFAINTGIKSYEIPAPLIQGGHVLVEVEYSLISSGTEAATLDDLVLSTKNLGWQVTQIGSLLPKLSAHLRKRGIKKTVSYIADRIERNSATKLRMATVGYSCSGRVIAVGKGVTSFMPGDRVACGGAGKATHSELVLVPENLVNIVPLGCDMKSAAFVTVGSIAMQGVRRCGIQLGESVAVIGLGLVGLISATLLKLSGARVIGFDLMESRVEMAKRIGIDEAHISGNNLFEVVASFTRHMGADVSLITASASSNDIVDTAAKITRKKGRVVVVGKVPLSLQWNPFFEKELDLRISCSYGPGRYDELYEGKGVDYPYAFVRWTEKRNMEEFLRLLSKKKMDLLSFAKEVLFSEVEKAYELLNRDINPPVAVYLKYGDGKHVKQEFETSIRCKSARLSDKVGVAVVGTGRFVKKAHLPSLRKLRKEVELVAIVNRTPATSRQLAEQYDACYISTSFDEVLEDKNVDAVIIGTRHNLHAEMVLKALNSGKHVFVEKPLAIKEEDLTRIEDFFRQKNSDKIPVLFVGYNRRFSPFILRLKELLQKRDTPLLMNYQLNTEIMPETHWLKGEEGGGKNIGEACHVYDLFTYLTESKAVSVKTDIPNNLDRPHARNENFITIIKFEDGSIGSLVYTSLGSKSYPKDMLYVFTGEKVFVMHNFQQLKIYGVNNKNIESDIQNKGLFEEMVAFIDIVKHVRSSPTPLWQHIQASRIAIEVEKQIQDGH